MYWHTLINRIRKMTGKQVKKQLEKTPKWADKIKKGYQNFQTYIDKNMQDTTLTQSVNRMIRMKNDLYRNIKYNRTMDKLKKILKGRELFPTPKKLFGRTFKQKMMQKQQQQQ